MWLLHLFRWVAHTHFSFEIRNSKWDFAIIEMVHLLGLAALGGSILIVNLRVLGIGLRRQSVSRVARELSPVLLSSLGVMIVSGLLLMTAFPLKYYYSPAFRLKMVLLVLALVSYFALHRKLVRSGANCAPSVWFRIAAVLSLMLWLGVGLAGRAIGFL